MAVNLLYQNTFRGDLIECGNTVGVAGSGAFASFAIADFTTSPPLPPSGGLTTSYPASASSANLPLLAGQTVKKAFLVWCGSQSNPIGGTLPPGTENNSITFQDPLGITTTVARIPAYTQLTVSGLFGGYVQVADVTGLVDAGGAGYYTVGQIPCVLGNGGGGWTLLVAYEDPAESYKNITMWALLDQPNTNITVSGFLTPQTGPVSGRLIVSARGGDSQQTGDFVKLGPTIGSQVFLSGPNNLADNFFADQINNNQGLLDTTGTFGSQNATPPAGAAPGQRNLYDVTRVDASAGLVNSQTSAVITLGTTNDAYTVTNLGLSIQVLVPDLMPVLKKVNTTVARVGDILTYTISYTNNGLVAVNNVTVTDLLEPGLSFVPGSVTVNAGTFPAADITGGINTGTIGPGATTIITFRASVDSLPPENPVPNIASVDFTFVPGPGADPISVNAPSNAVRTLIFQASRGVLFV